MENCDIVLRDGERLFQQAFATATGKVRPPGVELYVLGTICDQLSRHRDGTVSFQELTTSDGLWEEEKEGHLIAISGRATCFIRRCRLSTIGDRTFAVDGAMVWNILPPHGTLAPFRKTELFRKSFGKTILPGTAEDSRSEDVCHLIWATSDFVTFAVCQSFQCIYIAKLSCIFLEFVFAAIM